jgi:hypothetical protein
MTTIEKVTKRRRNRKTGKMETQHDVRLWRGSRVTLITKQQYTRNSKVVRMLSNLFGDIRTGRIRYKGWPVVLLFCLLASPATAVNSPRPSSFHVDNGRLVIAWTNISEAHPWILSYRLDVNQPWQWDMTRLHATNRSLSVAVPMTNTQGFMRLWPAAPEP